MTRGFACALVVLTMSVTALVPAQQGNFPGHPTASPRQFPTELTEVLAHAGARIEAFFTRAQSLVCTETVSLQPLNSGLTPDGFGRTVESELRVSWDPGLGGDAAIEAQIRRHVRKVNGRTPRQNDPRSCTTPEQQDVETQPLSMLLSQQRDKYRFSAAGTARVDGRAAMMIDFHEVGPVSVDVQAVEGLDDCVSYELTGGQRGRIWLDANTFDVLRLDQRLTGMIELRLPRVLTRRPGALPYMILERSDTTMRFGRVAFEQPDESLVLPLTSSTLRIMRGGGASGLRTTTKYSGYQRFLTGGRVVGDAAGDAF